MIIRKSDGAIGKLINDENVLLLYTESNVKKIKYIENDWRNLTLQEEAFNSLHLYFKHENEPHPLHGIYFNGELLNVKDIIELTRI